MQKFKIGNISVGDNQYPLIIAELGINHGGSIDLAIHLADQAISAGATVIKHQTHILDAEMSFESKRIKPGNSNQTIYDIIKENCLSEKEEIKLLNYIKSKKKIFISTPFSFQAAKRLAKLNIPAFKIGSGEANNFYFVDYICKFKKPIILSTGMNSISSIQKSVNVIRRNKVPYALLHCTNIYPTPHHLVKLDCLVELKNFFKDAVVGLSDHTEGIFTSIGAIGLGAKIIEKHFIDKKSRKGPDVSSSMDYSELKNLILASNVIYKSKLGGNKKKLLKQEIKTMKFAFQSVVSNRDILPGETINKNDICLKRPGTGDFGLNDFKKILGKKVCRKIKKNYQLKKYHFTK